MTRAEAIEAGKRAAEADVLRVGGDLWAFASMEVDPPADLTEAEGAEWMGGYGVQYVEIIDRILPAEMSIEDYRALPEAERWRLTLQNADERARGPE